MQDGAILIEVGGRWEALQSVATMYKTGSIYMSLALFASFVVFCTGAFWLWWKEKSKTVVNYNHNIES